MYCLVLGFSRQGNGAAYIEIHKITDIFVEAMPAAAGQRQRTGLIAASICTPSNLLLACAYRVSTTRETMPLVMLKESPPIGYLTIPHATSNSKSYPFSYGCNKLLTSSHTEQTVFVKVPREAAVTKHV